MTLRDTAVFGLLLMIKGVARSFYRIRWSWIGEVPAEPWNDLRLVALLNHTSLYEPLFAGLTPSSFLRRLATRGVVPAADKTINRPIVGRFFRVIAGKVVSVTRERDHTWREVLQSVGQDSMVVILPEGRMKRANGLDSSGKPMTVRGGIADLLEALDGGRMLLAYSGGLHHVQVPGQRWPRLFQTIRMNLEVIDIESYRESLRQAGGASDFKRAVITDLEARRDRFCPPEEPTRASRSRRLAVAKEEQR